MSSFLVTSETMHRVIQGFRFAGCMPSLPGLALTTNNHVDKLGEALFAMNQEALRQRYGDEPTPISYTYRCDDYLRLECYKATRSFLYQCSEGDVPDCELFKLTRDMAAALAEEICQDLPDYAAWPWDFPEPTHTVETINA